ncbi:dna-directed rna polymerases i ii and iii subunit rpabc2 [Holotrichia oblita]|uniref:Dna-directed rna polymerases i ii and iii subunit rpabc2 n=1 Tax=Holotrichia oblita TaxID=644536 RepID=A0ACB9TA09_HOLOL|nr:dna-directed rna polymerases i ii and iii subunit rpabc2 [Holotrichia oblita]
MNKAKRYGDADPAFRNFIRPCQHNGRSFKCLSLQQREMHSIRERFYSDASKVNQDVRLCHMLSAEPVRRRRSQGLIEQKKMTVSYFLKKRNGESIRVCQKFFTAVLGITKHRTNTVAKVILEGGTPREKRGGDRVSNKTEDKKNLVRYFIKKLKGRESHYNRKKSRRMYLSANLSIARLRKMFNHQNEAANWLSYNMFRNIFVNEFNIGFSSPASDTTVAIILVVASLVLAEPPRFRSFARQTAPAPEAEAVPYAPRGWRPAGAPFSLPQRSQPHQNYGAPIANNNNYPQGLYGAPAQQQQPSPQYGPPEVATEMPTTTEGGAEDFTETPAENIREGDNKKSEKIEQPQNPAFFIIPQPERLVYAVQSAPLVALPQAKYVAAANLQALPLTAVQTSVVSPYSSTYIQYYQ